MAKSEHTSASRMKYLSLIRQATGIELDICSPEEFEGDQKPIRQSESGDHIFIRNENLTILQRAQKREQLTKSRQQNNLEQIFSMALEYINQDAKFDKLDLDWLMKFTDLALVIYSSTMQELWAKILATEIIQPGTFSFRTLKALSEINSKEAMIFYRAVKLMTRVGDEKSGRIITGAYKKPTFMSMLVNRTRQSINLSKFGLAYPHIMTLADLGLIYNQEIESAPFQTKQILTLHFHSQVLNLTGKQKDIIVTYYKFTQTGYELSKLVSVEPEGEYLSTLLKEFSELISSNQAVNQTA